jgi:glycosyltransferase involved in cell wall biosynthesis
MLNPANDLRPGPALAPAQPRPIAPSARRLQSEIILDISRLISRAGFSAPTGVDRVEMAYARCLLKRAPAQVGFAAVLPGGVYGRLSREATTRFLDDTLRAWRGEAPPVGRLATLLRLWPRLTRDPADKRPQPRVYLQVSPHHLDQPQKVGAILRRESARFVCLVHDLIPIEYPEYARPRVPAEHRRRMNTVADFADGVITTSETIRQSFLAYLDQEGRTAAVTVAPLGAERRLSIAPASPQLSERPYFVAVGTIEPRKNHLLLLNLWRRLVEERGADMTPKLLLIGRRGWENENILDMLDRCPSLKGVVEERGHLSDAAMWPLIQNARALLMPSFAEGFGLPVVEALQLGAPVLCSDIPAHREIAGGVAEFFDPLDGVEWRQAVLDYASPTSARRQAQIQRMARWQAPSWEDHVDAALNLIEEISQ